MVKYFSRKSRIIPHYNNYIKIIISGIGVYKKIEIVATQELQEKVVFMV